MKKFLKILGLIFLVVFICFYIAFLFVLPKVVNLNEYKQIIADSAQKEARLNVDFSDAKLVTTPCLAVGAKINDITIKLPDGSLLFSADTIKTTISLPNMLLLTIKLSDISIEKPYINLEIADGNHFKAVKLIENIINDKKQKMIGKVQTEEKQMPFDASLIRIQIPNIKITDYKILINDIQANHYLNLKGNELLLGYFNGKRAVAKGDAHLFCDTVENINIKFDINTFLPPMVQKSDSEDDKAVRIEIPFINPVSIYRKYDLKTNINTKLKIKNSRNKITSKGYLNVDNLSLIVENIKLPESYMHAKTIGEKINIDSNINITPNAKINLLGSITYGKNPKTDITIKTGKIYFQDLLDFSKAILESMGIKNELQKYTAKGFIEADTYIKTNFKKLKSTGSIICKDGELTIQNIGKVISSANINILLNNNILNINKSSLFIENSKIQLDGSIDNSSYADISVTTDNLSLPFIFKAFTPSNIKQMYSLNSGNAKIKIFIKGKLKEAISSIEIFVNNIIFSDNYNNFVVENSDFEAKLLANAKAVSAGIVNNNFKITMPQTKSSIFIPTTKINYADNNILLEENKIVLNNNSELLYNGNITDIQNLKDIAFHLKGNIKTDDIIQLLGKDTTQYFNKKGAIPLQIDFTGNHNKQTLFVQCLSDKNNFITPVNLDILQNKPAVLQAMIDFKTGRFKIKNTGLYEKIVTTDENGNEKINLKEIFDINGTVAGDTINLIQMNIHNHIKGNIVLFSKSLFTLEKSKLIIYGKTSRPRIRGAINLVKVSIPELLATLEKMSLKFARQNADIDIKNLLLNNSDINLSTSFKFIQSGIFKIDSLNFKSNLIDVDNITEIAENSAKYFSSTNTKTSSQTTQNDNIPLVIQDGDINIKQLKTGNIQANDITSKIYIDKNILSVKDLDTSVFNGKVQGNVDVNLLNSDIVIDMTGQNINIQKAMEDAAGIKNTLSGITDFSVNLSLGGSTYEQQMKSLKGNIVFNAKNGQFGPFAKIENLIIAENIRESEFFQSALGGIIQKLTTIDTTHYDKLTGKISFENGICNIEEISSTGNILMMHIFGQFDLLQNTIDMKVRAKMTSLIAEMLGPIAAINPIKLLNSAAGTNVVTAKAFSLFCETLDEEEINQIPSFEDKYIDMSANANRFQLVARGDVSKPLTLIKSFKWITTPVDFQKAKDFVASIPNPVDNNTEETIEEAFAEQERLEKEKKTLMYKVKHIFQKKENEEE